MQYLSVWLTLSPRTDGLRVILKITADMTYDMGFTLYRSV